MKRQQSAGSAATAAPAEAWMTEETAELARAFVTLQDEDEAMRYLRDLCTVTELREFGERWHVARLLDAGQSYAEIARQTGASSATISRVNQWLRYGRGGYRMVIDRLRAQGSERPADEARGQ